MKTKEIEIFGGYIEADATCRCEKNHAVYSVVFKIKKYNGILFSLQRRCTLGVSVKASQVWFRSTISLVKQGGYIDL